MKHWKKLFSKLDPSIGKFQWRNHPRSTLSSVPVGPLPVLCHTLWAYLSWSCILLFCSASPGWRSSSRRCWCIFGWYNHVSTGRGATSGTTLREAGIKLNPTKTNLFEKEVEFFGHRVSEEGAFMVPEYVSRILEWPIPENVTNLCWAVDFLNYYRTFIKNFSKLAAPLNEKSLSGNLKGEFIWTLEMDNSNQKLK